MGLNGSRVSPVSVRRGTRHLPVSTVWTRSRDGPVEERCRRSSEVGSSSTRTSSVLRGRVPERGLGEPTCRRYLRSVRRVRTSGSPYQRNGTPGSKSLVSDSGPLVSRDRVGPSWWFVCPQGKGVFVLTVKHRKITFEVPRLLICCTGMDKRDGKERPRTPVFDSTGSCREG